MRRFFKKILWVFAIAAGGLFSLVVLVWLFHEDTLADKIQHKAFIELDQAMRSANLGERIPLANIAGIDWDVVCRVSTYMGGKDVLRQYYDFDFAEFDSADVMPMDAEDGLVFVDFDQKILVTILFNVSIFNGNNISSCLSGKEAYLIQKSGHEDKISAFVLSD